MASVSTYLNFNGQAEAAFNYYKSIFGGEFGNIARFSDMPPSDDAPPMPEAVKQQIMHIDLAILGSHRLMGSDMPAMMGKLNPGNNFHISLAPDSRAETDRLYQALSEGGTITMELKDMFWGAYYGACTDKFGVQWMFNFEGK